MIKKNKTASQLALDIQSQKATLEKYQRSNSEYSVANQNLRNEYVTLTSNTNDLAQEYSKRKTAQDERLRSKYNQARGKYIQKYRRGKAAGEEKLDGIRSLLDDGQMKLDQQNLQIQDNASLIRELGALKGFIQSRPIVSELDFMTVCSFLDSAKQKRSNGQINESDNDLKEARNVLLTSVIFQGVYNGMPYVRREQHDLAVASAADLSRKLDLANEKIGILENAFKAHENCSIAIKSHLPSNDWGAYQAFQTSLLPRQNFGSSLENTFTKNGKVRTSIPKQYTYAGMWRKRFHRK
jgi:hypothetical protein